MVQGAAGSSSSTLKISFASQRDSTDGRRRTRDRTQGSRVRVNASRVLVCVVFPSSVRLFRAPSQKVETRDRGCYTAIDIDGRGVERGRDDADEVDRDDDVGFANAETVHGARLQDGLDCRGFVGFVGVGVRARG